MIGLFVKVLGSSTVDRDSISGSLQPSQKSGAGQEIEKNCYLKFDEFL